MSSKFRLMVVGVIATGVFLVSTPQSGVCFERTCCTSSKGPFWAYGISCNNCGAQWVSEEGGPCNSNTPTYSQCP